ncbi:MAG: cyclase family protein [Candidatus Omnitrophota bacterium]
MQIIDLSLPIDDTLDETHAANIQRISHSQGVEHLNWVLMSKDRVSEAKFKRGERLIAPGDVPDEELLSLEIVNSSVHMGTHVDAPYHYGSKSEGKPSKYINDLPLEWCYCDGVVLDFKYKKYPEIINHKDVVNALNKINYKLKPLDIILFNTGADKFIGKPEYVNKYVGVLPEAIEYLLDFGIKMIGIDTLGLDRPCPDMFTEFLKTKNKSVLWPSHFLGRRREYAHIERLANLDKIPVAFGFKVSCFPVKIRNAGAGWARVVAIL